MQDKEQLILEAAQRLFIAVGIKKATVEAIAQEAGIGKGTVYLYFKRKEDIMVSLARQRMDEMIAEVRQEVARGGEAEERLGRVFSVLFEHRDGILKRCNISLELSQEFRDQREIRLLEREYFVLWRQIIEDILTDGIAKGEFREIPVRDAASILWYAMEGLDAIWQQNMSLAGMEKGIKMYIDLVVNGLKKR